MDAYDKSDVENDFRRIDEIMRSDIFNPNNFGNPLFQSAFIGMLIHLRDLMYKVEKYGKRIDFFDDVTVKGDVTDVTSLIKYVRDALCHPDSDNHYVEGGMQATFNVIAGKATFIKTRDFEQSNPYIDDICFFFGSQRIFLKRHILRAIEEAKAQLTPLIRIDRSRNTS